MRRSASPDEFASERGDVDLPDKIAGKTVIGVEGEWIVGRAYVLRQTETNRLGAT